MISHGLTSSGLFKITGELENYNIMKNKGMNIIRPKLYILLFIYILSNISFPWTINIISEIEIMKGIYIYSKNIIITILIILYFLFLYNFLIIYRIFSKNIIILYKDIKREEIVWLLINISIIIIITFNRKVSIGI